VPSIEDRIAEKVEQAWLDLAKGASPRIVDTRFDGYAAGRSVAADVVFS